MMTGLDFWATDPWTDSKLPIFDTWSTEFMLREWSCEIMRDEITAALMAALRSVPHGHDE
jgi:hypothetical protein